MQYGESEKGVIQFLSRGRDRTLQYSDDDDVFYVCLKIESCEVCVLFEVFKNK